jgi:RNA polymerase sigma-54 factor
VEEILEKIQTFHPVGVGARDLKDCLMIQLRRLGKDNSLEWRIVDRFLDDLGKRRFPEIARRLSTAVEHVQRAANFIATLDPKPGQIFAADPNNYVLPDVAVEKIGGAWQIALNGDQIPHLRISNVYKDLMSQDGSGSEVKDYIRDTIRSGKFLIKSIHQRQQTISNIANFKCRVSTKGGEACWRAKSPLALLVCRCAIPAIVIPQTHLCKWNNCISYIRRSTNSSSPRWIL